MKYGGRSKEWRGESKMKDYVIPVTLKKLSYCCHLHQYVNSSISCLHWLKGVSRRNWCAVPWFSCSGCITNQLSTPRHCSLLWASSSNWHFPKSTISGLVPHISFIMFDLLRQQLLVIIWNQLFFLNAAIWIDEQNLFSNYLSQSCKISAIINQKLVELNFQHSLP